MSYDLKNKIIFITGAASGIGELVVRYMLDEGAKHVTFTDINQTKSETFEDELASKHGADKVKFIKCNSANDQELIDAFDWVITTLGYIDIVINNAGIMNDAPSVYKLEIKLNVTSVVTGTLKAIEIMRKDKGGRGGTVINISSVAGITQAPAIPIYYATKTAVLQFSNCIGHAENYDMTDVRVITICFGATATNLLQGVRCFDPSVEDKILPNTTSRHPLQKVEAAANGLIEAYKQGESGSTWLIQNEKIRDITPVVRKAFGFLEDVVFNE